MDLAFLDFVIYEMQQEPLINKASHDDVLVQPCKASQESDYHDVREPSIKRTSRALSFWLLHQYSRVSEALALI